MPCILHLTMSVWPSKPHVRGPTKPVTTKQPFSVHSQNVKHICVHSLNGKHIPVHKNRPCFCTQNVKALFWTLTECKAYLWSGAGWRLRSWSVCAVLPENVIKNIVLVNDHLWIILTSRAVRDNHVCVINFYYVCDKFLLLSNAVWSSQVCRLTQFGIPN